MIRYLTSVVVLSVGLTACGKKEPAPVVEKVAPARVSIEAEAPPPPAEPPVAPPQASAAVAPGTAASEPAPPQETPAVAPRKVDQIEGWLHQYQAGDAAARADIVKKIRAANLTAAEKAFLEMTRQRYGYAPIPLN